MPLMRRPLLFTFTALLVASTGAVAQAATRVLEEIVVTAPKRKENLTDVPISIAVINSEALMRTGVRQMREVAEFVPNLSISSGNDNSTAVRVRGVGANTRNIGFDTRVGVYVDGVYMGQSPAQNLDIVDLERVEVARGPQGTLFGKNSVAGAINLVSKKPSQERELQVTGEIGNYSSHRISAVANLPISDSTAARFAIVDHARDGFIDNVTTGTEYNERDGTSLRGHLAFNGENYDVNISGDYTESERVSFFGTAITDWSGSVPNTASPGRFNIDNNIDNFEEREIWGLSATAEMDLGSDYSLTSITAYRDTSVERRQDSDHSFNDIISVIYPDNYEQTTQEFQIFSPDNSRFKYVAGLYLFYEEATTERRTVTGDDFDIVLSALAPPLAPFGSAFSELGVGTFGTVDTESYSAYINGTYELTERLTLGFGARYSDEEREVDYNLIGDVADLGFTQIPAASLFGIAVGPVVDGQTVLNIQDKRSFGDFSPMLSLSYALADDINLYVKYSEAFKSGGFNVDFVSQNVLDEGIDFDTETVEAWELGIKGTTLEKRLRFNLTAFQMDFQDYQLNQFIQLSNNTSTITIQNAAEVRSRGLEAEVTWYPTINLMLQGAVGYNDAEFESFPGGGSVRNPQGLGADLAGNKLPVAPEWTSAFAAQHNMPLPGFAAELVTRLDWTYTDSFFSTEDNVSFATPANRIPWGEVDSYWLLNGRIGLEGEHWSAYLWGRNVLDEEYNLDWTSDFLGTLAVFPGTPRTYGVEVSWKLR